MSFVNKFHQNITSRIRMTNNNSKYRLRLQVKQHFQHDSITSYRINLPPVLKLRLMSVPGEKLCFNETSFTVSLRKI